MNDEDKIKEIIRSNTLVNIRLGLTLALSQGLNWEYIAEKCFYGEWLLFRSGKIFYPSDYEDQRGLIWINKDTRSHKPIVFQLVKNHESYYKTRMRPKFESKLGSVQLSNKPEIIKRMIIFLKLILDE